MLLAEAAPLVQVPEGREEDPDCDDASAEMNFAPPDVVDYQGSTSMQRLNRSLWSEGSGSSTVVSGGPTVPCQHLFYIYTYLHICSYLSRTYKMNLSAHALQM